MESRECGGGRVVGSTRRVDKPQHGFVAVPHPLHWDNVGLYVSTRLANDSLNQRYPMPGGPSAVEQIEFPTPIPPIRYRHKYVQLTHTLSLHLNK